LTSDIYLSSRSLVEAGKNGLIKLESPLRQLSESANKFRDVRNLLTHLDAFISNSGQHGITGADHSGCGLGSRYLVLSGDKIHFTYRRSKKDLTAAKEVDIGKSSFGGIFESARLVYSEITSHKLHAESYPPASRLYPP
jgi:hypothetical protein